MCLNSIAALQVLDEADTMFDAGFGPEVTKAVAFRSVNCESLLLGNHPSKVA